MLNLQQVVTEDRYSKQGVKELLFNEIDFGLLAQTMECLQPWLKGAKTATIKGMSLEDIAIQVLLVILTIRDTALFTSLVGMLTYKLTGSPTNNVITAGELLAKMSDCPLLILELRGQYIIASTPILLSDSSLARINRMAYVPPMLVEPKEVTDNKSSGHLRLKIPLILGKNKGHNLPQNYKFINNLNSIAFSLNEFILEYEEELTVHDTTTIEAYNEVYNYLLENGNKFYFTNNFDNRGRSYCAGWQCNYQGTDFKKASIQLNTKELICNTLQD